ncbi:hypothetical protein D3C75_636850 [compost metagenome]
MTEFEKDEFTTALSERYAEIQMYHSGDKELIGIWNDAIEELTPELKSQFEQKHNQLTVGHKG